MIQSSGSAEHNIFNIPNFIEISDWTDGEHADKLEGTHKKEYIGSLVFLHKFSPLSCKEFICRPNFFWMNVVEL